MLTTAQTLAVAGILTAAAIAFCTAIVVLIVRSTQWQAGRHAAPPTTPQPPVPPAQDGGERRRLADDWREQVVPGPDPVLVRRYVLPRTLATGAGR